MVTAAVHKRNNQFSDFWCFAQFGHTKIKGICRILFSSIFIPNQFKTSAHSCKVHAIFKNIFVGQDPASQTPRLKLLK